MRKIIYYLKRIYVVINRKPGYIVVGFKNSDISAISYLCSSNSVLYAKYLALVGDQKNELSQIVTNWDYPQNHVTKYIAISIESLNCLIQLSDESINTRIYHHIRHDDKAKIFELRSNLINALMWLFQNDNTEQCTLGYPEQNEKRGGKNILSLN